MAKTTNPKSKALVPDHSPQSTLTRTATSIFCTMAAVLVATATQNSACRRHQMTGIQDASHGQVNEKGLSTSQNLELSILEVRGMGRLRNDMRFYRGETLDCIMQISGFDAPQGRLHLLSTMTMTLAHKGLFWKDGPKTLVNQTIPAGRSRRLVRLRMGLRLSTAEPAGKHRLTLRVEEPETHRYGTAALDFEVKGRRLRRFSKLSIAKFDVPDPLDLRPGGTVHLPIWLGGFQTKVDPEGRHHLKLEGTITWLQTANPTSGTAKTSGRLSKTKSFSVSFEDLRFVPAQIPLRPEVQVPGKVGRYDLTITIWQRPAGGTTGQGRTTLPRSKRKRYVVRRTVHGLAVQPAGLGIYDMAIMGPGDNPVRRFHRGQTMKVTFEVWSPRATDLIGDFAIEGPDGGIFLLRKGAFRISPRMSRRGTDLSRRIVVPIELPRYCPLGRYRLLVRIRNSDGGISASRHMTFVVEGRPLPALPKLRITHWTLGTHPTILPRLFQGQDVPIRVVVGGMHLENIPPAGHRLDLVLNILLRNLDGTMIAKEPEAAHVSRTLTFAPRRVPLEATWRVPEEISGILLLQVEVEDLLTHRVTVSQKKIAVLPR